MGYEPRENIVTGERSAPIGMLFSDVAFFYQPFSSLQSQAERHLYFGSFKNPLADRFQITLPSQLNKNAALSLRLSQVCDFFRQPTSINQWRKGIMSLDLQEIERVHAWVTAMCQTLAMESLSPPSNLDKFLSPKCSFTVHVASSNQQEDTPPK